jgi:hypothetical protein
MSEDKDWQYRQDVISGKRRPGEADTNVRSTDHTESRDDASKEDKSGEGTRTQDEPDEATAVQGDGPHGESI